MRDRPRKAAKSQGGKGATGARNSSDATGTASQARRSFPCCRRLASGNAADRNEKAGLFGRLSKGVEMMVGRALRSSGVSSTQRWMVVSARGIRCWCDHRRGHLEPAATCRWSARPACRLVLGTISDLSRLRQHTCAKRRCSRAVPVPLLLNSDRQTCQPRPQWRDLCLLNDEQAKRSRCRDCNRPVRGEIRNRQK